MYLTNRTICPSSPSGYRDCPRRTAARMFSHDLKGLGFDLKNRETSIGALIGSGIHEGAGCGTGGDHSARHLVAAAAIRELLSL